MGKLKNFDMAEYLGETVESQDVIPWAVGNDAVPDSTGVSAPADCVAVMTGSVVRVLVVMDYLKSWFCYN